MYWKRHHRHHTILILMESIGERLRVGRGFIGIGTVCRSFGFRLHLEDSTACDGLSTWWLNRVLGHILVTCSLPLILVCLLLRLLVLLSCSYELLQSRYGHYKAAALVVDILGVVRTLGLTVKFLELAILTLRR